MIYHEKYDGKVICKSSGKQIATIANDHPLWAKYLAAKADGKLGEPIPAPTPPTQPAPLTEAEQAAQDLAASDYAFVIGGARMLEDIADERVADGKYVSQAVEDDAAARKALRDKL